MEVSCTACFIGLSNAGKTTILKSQSGNLNEIYPTAGFQISYINSGSRTILCYDCSGQGRTRSNWSLFFNLSDVIVYVIDAADPALFQVAKKHLYRILSLNKQNKKKQLCIMLNKSDHKDRVSREILYKALEPEELQTMVSKLYVKQTSAYTKDGLQQCFDWMAKSLNHII